MKARFAVLATIVVLTTTCSVPAASIALAPSKDNTLIQQTNPNSQLSNGLGDIFVGRTNQNPATISVRRGLIYFDIAAAVPSGSTITGATLTLRDVQGLNGDRATSLHRVLQNWGEGTSYQSGGMGSAATNGDATWLYTFYDAANPGSSPQWNTPGGDFDPIVSGSTIVSDDNGGGQFFAWSGVGMTANVQDWLNNPSGNFGWLVQGDESTNQTAKRFNGRTLNNVGDVAPVLLVTYVPEPASICLLIFSAAGVVAFFRERRSVT